MGSVGVSATERREDDLTAEERAQLAALERAEGARKAAKLLGVTVLQIVDALASKPLPAGPLRRLILALAALRPPEPEEGVDEDTAAAQRGHAIVVALQAQRNQHSA